MQTEPRPPLLKRLRSAHWQVLDWLIALGYGLVLSVGRLLPAGQSVPVGLAAIAVLSLGIAIRRRHPVVALAVVLVVLVGLQWPYQSLLPAWCALYLVAVSRPRWTAWAALAATVFAPLVAVSTIDRAFLLALMSGLIWTIGHAVGRNRAYERNLRLHRARQAEADLARAQRGVTDERLRIARELHDIVAHSMSVITVQAGFGHLVIDDHPEQARDALSAIETTGRQALIEMRRLLGVLRDGDPNPAATLTPTPSLTNLDLLVAQTAKAGVDVQVDISGEPRELPSGIELSAYRIVQEALTNVVKHAGTSVSRVSLTYGEKDLSIEVTDDGQGQQAIDGHGHGLIGMRERVNLYGGSLQAGPLPGQGFRVAARLPIAKAAA